MMHYILWLCCWSLNDVPTLQCMCRSSVCVRVFLCIYTGYITMCACWGLKWRWAVISRHLPPSIHPAPFPLSGRSMQVGYSHIIFGEGQMAAFCSLTALSLPPSPYPTSNPGHSGHFTTGWAKRQWIPTWLCDWLQCCWASLTVSVSCLLLPSPSP